MIGSPTNMVNVDYEDLGLLLFSSVSHWFAFHSPFNKFSTFSYRIYIESRTLICSNLREKARKTNIQRASSRWESKIPSNFSKKWCNILTDSRMILVILWLILICLLHLSVLHLTKYQNYGAFAWRKCCCRRFEEIWSKIPGWTFCWTCQCFCTIWLCLVFGTIQIPFRYTQRNSAARRSIHSKISYLS